jgi:hypothetical protein
MSIGKQPWTGQQDAILADLVRDGLGNAAIARRMGRSLGSIQNRVGTLGLTGRQPSPETLALNSRDIYLPPALAPSRQRNCLSCRAVFHSEGAHNRLCDDCRATTHQGILTAGFMGDGCRRVGRAGGS